jgi:hypothetical protein
MNRTYIVQILLRAREEISAVAMKAANAIQQVTAAQRENNEASRISTQHAVQHATSLEKLVAAHVGEKKGAKESAAAIRELAAARKQLMEEEKRQLELLNQQLRAERAASNERKSQHHEQVTQLRAQAAARELQIGKIDKEVKALQRQARALATSADQEAAASKRKTDTIGKEISTRRNLVDTLKREHAELNRMAVDAERNRGGILRFFQDIRASAKDADVDLARLAANFRGFQIAFVIKYAQALISTLVSLGAQLVAVASSALQAGAGLAGGLAAGAAQAFPVIGALVAVLSRVATVIKAVNLQQQQSLVSGRDAAASAEGQRAAQQRLADATRERNVALREAKEGVQALMLAERQAVLTFEDAQAALRRAIDTGDAGAVAQAQIDVSRARSGRTEARSDAGFARRTGMTPQGSERLAAAERQVADARRQVATATDKQTAATDRLAEMLNQLSPAERGLYQAILRIRKTVEENVRPITDIIIRAFSRGVNRANELLQDPQILRAFRRVATAISGVVDDLVDLGSNRQSRNFFSFLAMEITRNGPLITRIIERLWGTFRNLARAGAPAFRELLRFLGSLAENAQNATQPIGALSRFFMDGIEHFKSWVRLGLAAIDLFAALAGASSSSGLKGIKDATVWLREMADRIRDNRDQVTKFFEDARHSVGDILRVIGALGMEVLRVFNTRNVEQFANFMIKVLIPAIGSVIQIMGLLTTAVHFLLSLPFVSDFAQWAVTFIALAKGLMILRAAVVALRVIAISFVATFGAIPAIVLGVVAAIALLERKFGFIKSFANLFKSAQDRSREAADKLTGAIERQIEALRRQRDAEMSRKNAKIGLERAEIATLRAREEIARVDEAIRTGELKGQDADIAKREARLGLKQAILDEKQARIDLKSARDEERKSDVKAIDDSKKTIDAVKDRVTALKDERAGLKDRRDLAQRNVDIDKAYLKTLTPGTERYRDAVEELRSSKRKLASADEALRDNSRKLRSEADKGRDAFKRWQKAVGRAGGSTETFGDTVNRTMEGIVSDVNSVLVEFGAKPLKWKSRRKKTKVESGDPFEQISGIDDPIGGFARGGLIPGVGDGDSRLVRAEPGEGFINKTAVRALGGKAFIDYINNAIPRFQRGGLVPIPGQGQLIDRRILKDVMAIIRNYKVRISAGYAPTGHAASGEHPLGLATDIVPGPGGNWGLVDKLAAWAEPQQNQPRYPFRWVGYTGDAAHGRGDHLHLSWLHNMLKTVETLRGRIGMSSEVPQRIFTGPAGALMNMIRGSERRARRAANRYVDRKLNETGDGGPTGGDENVTGSGAGLMRRISQQRGWNFSDWWALDAAETSHGQNLANPTSSARLRGQFLDMNWGKYGPGSDPRQNPTMAQQIRAMAAYIAERYGNPSRAWDWHQSHNWYQHGGSVPGFGGGDRIPAMLEGGEHIWTKEEVSRVGGHGVMRALRSMFGGGGQGGSSGYQAGGQTMATYRPSTPFIPPTFLSRLRSSLAPLTESFEILDKIRDVFEGFRGHLKKGADLAGRIRRTFARIFDEGGVMDKLRAQTAAIGARAAIRLQTSQFRVEGGLGIRTNLSAGELGRREVGALVDMRGGLQNEGAALGSAEQAAQAALRRANRMSGAAGRRARQQAQAELNRIQQAKRDNQLALAQNAQDIVERQEATQAAQVEEINARASEGERRAGLQARVAQLGGRTNFGMIGQSLQTRGSAMATQRNELAAMLGIASATGNISLVRSLTESIEDLDVSIQENADAIRANTDAARAADIEAINNRFGFTSGVLGAAQSFFQGLGNLTGQDVTGSLLGIAQNQGTALATQRTGLLGQLTSILGLTGDEAANVQNMTGSSLVNYLLTISSGPIFDSIVSGMTQAQREQFEGLIMALIGNSTAVNENTEAVNQINGTTNTQSFSSSWWQRFRLAIFTGGGDVLPQYPISAPRMHDGGPVMQNGLYELQVGEMVGTMRDRIAAGAAAGGDTYVTNITTPTEVLNEAEVGQKIAFHRRTRGR